MHIILENITATMIIKSINVLSAMCLMNYYPSLLERVRWVMERVVQ